MTLLIFGAGGIGSVLGAFLARMGHSVTLLGRPWHLDAIEKEGLRISGLWGSFTTKAFELARDTGELERAGAAFDHIFLTVKSFDTARAVEQMRPLIRPGTTVVSFQNGLGNIETALAVIPPAQFLAARAIFGVVTEPGRCRVTVNADDLLVGRPGAPTRTADPAAQKVAQALSDARLPARAVGDIETHLWSKVIYNSALNAICALGEIPYGDILKNAETKAQMENVVRECYAVARSLGVKLEPADAGEYLELLTGKLIPLTASHFPSTLQDLRRGKRVEIDALNGAIARLGQKAGVPTPENERLADAVRQKYSDNLT